jgi:hypothetical protein
MQVKLWIVEIHAVMLEVLNQRVGTPVSQDFNRSLKRYSENWLVF